jgi:thioredoxin reductase
VCMFQELKALHGTDRIEAATIFDNRTGEEKTVEVDALVLAMGFLANLGPIKEWGLQIVQNSVVVDHMMQTNLPGVYGVGDLVTYEGKLKLIATATGEAAVAANYAKNRIDPASKVNPGHSSEKDQ